MQSFNLKVLFIAVLTVFCAATAVGEESYTEKEIGLGVIDAYIPASQRADRDAHIVVNGLFPNSCYSFSGADVTHIDDFTHKIRTVVKVRSGVCSRVLKPFTEQIPLGKLKRGEHKITLVADDDTYFEKILLID